MKPIWVKRGRLLLNELAGLVDAGPDPYHYEYQFRRHQCRELEKASSSCRISNLPDPSVERRMRGVKGEGVRVFWTRAWDATASSSNWWLPPIGFE